MARWYGTLTHSLSFPLVNVDKLISFHYKPSKIHRLLPLSMVVSYHPKTTRCKLLTIVRLRISSPYPMSIFEKVYNAPRSLTCTLSFLSSQIFYTNLVGNKILVVIVFQSSILIYFYFLLCWKCCGRGGMHGGMWERGKKEGWWFTRLLCVGWMFVYNEIWRFSYEDVTIGCLLWSSFLYFCGHHDFLQAIFSSPIPQEPIHSSKMVDVCNANLSNPNSHQTTQPMRTITKIIYTSFICTLSSSHPWEP